jgi:ubiquinone/menaquinone biosynthesis C-methylase UbiE
MDDSNQKVGRLFDALATDYDRSGVDFFGPIGAGLLEHVGPRPGERWLDVGCGPGVVLLDAAEAVGPEGEVVGVDIAPTMVERAAAAATERGLGNVHVAVGDATAPDVEGLFDAVVSSLVLFFLADPSAALMSWRGLLAPGGRLGISTFGPWDPRLEHVEEVLEQWIPPAMRDPRTTGEASPFASDAGVEGLVSGAGYVDVRTENLALPVRFRDADQWYAFSWSTGQRGMWLAVPEERRPEVRAEAARRFAEHADADGSATFTIGIRYTLGSAPR